LSFQLNNEGLLFALQGAEKELVKSLEPLRNQLAAIPAQLERIFAGEKAAIDIENKQRAAKGQPQRPPFNSAILIAGSSPVRGLLEQQSTGIPGQISNINTQLAKNREQQAQIFLNVKLFDEASGESNLAIDEATKDIFKNLTDSLSLFGSQLNANPNFPETPKQNNDFDLKTLALIGGGFIAIIMPLVTRQANQGNIFREPLEPADWIDGDLWSDTTANTVKVNVGGTATDIGNASDATQVLTNKTIDLDANTITGTLAEFNTALQSGDFTSLLGIETMTNKTLTAADNTVSVDAGDVTGGTLLVTRGGTGVSDPTSGEILIGAGSSAMTTETFLTTQTVTKTNTFSITSGTYADVTNMTLTLANRSGGQALFGYKISVGLVGAAVGSLQMVDDGSLIVGTESHFNADASVNLTQGYSGMLVLPLDGSVIKLQGLKTTGTMQVNSGTDDESYFFVLEIGGT